MADDLWAMRASRQAAARVEALFARLLLRDDVLAELQAQPAADPEIQTACCKLAGTWAEPAESCNNSSWALIRERGQTNAIYQRGARLAQAACTLNPNNSSFLNTLGVAQYRLGQVAAALATLTRSNELNREKNPADLAFLAMTYQRLGKLAEAKAKLDRLRDLMRHASGNISQSPENQSFLAEAEAVVLLDPVFPAEPFAP
jgi:tetratricopeptide (TPR) repeat protein